MIFPQNKISLNVIFLAALGFSFLSILISTNSFAVPANPDVFEKRQPDGAKFKARLAGDEYANWTETESGYTIKRDFDGFWKFLENNESPLLTSVRAHETPPQGLTKHVMPAASQAQKLKRRAKPDTGVYRGRQI